MIYIKPFNNKLYFFKEELLFNESFFEIENYFYSSQYRDFINDIIEELDDKLFSQYNDLLPINESYLSSDDTGLAFVLWVDDLPNARNLPHSIYRVKVCFHGNKHSIKFFPRTELVRKEKHYPPEVKRELKSIFKFIDNNRQLLKDYYDGKYEKIDDIMPLINKNKRKGKK